MAGYLDLDQARAFYGLQPRIVGVYQALERNTQPSSSRLGIISLMRERFREAVFEILSESVGHAGDYDFRDIDDQAEYLQAVQIAGAIALIELGGPRENQDFFLALSGE